MTFSKEIDQ